MILEHVTGLNDVILTWLPFFSLGFFAELGVALAGSAISSLFGSSGASSQDRALRRAQGTQAAYQKEVLGLYRNLLAEGKPLRQAQQGLGLEGIKWTTEDLMRPPGTNALFQEAVGNLAASLSRYGLSPDSSAFARGSADLLARDIEDVRSKRLMAAQFGSTGVQEASNLLGMAGGAATNISNLQASQGAVQGGLYGSIGQSIAQAPFAAALLSGAFGK